MIVSIRWGQNGYLFFSSSFISFLTLCCNAKNEDLYQIWSVKVAISIYIGLASEREIEKEKQKNADCWWNRIKEEVWYDFGRQTQIIRGKNRVIRN